MSGAYWGLTALDIMGRLGDMNPDEIVPWVIKCQDECGTRLLNQLLKFDLVNYDCTLRWWEVGCRDSRLDAHRY